ncbi:hypothetical protein KSP40_PGU021993 [Platanthera guangdongensis]|uniref:PDZ domain-containing protein n=1 Tax=Platanthera guangdongensis TaxID=2320717 RepID=A0ABR2M389_9ASPA
MREARESSAVGLFVAEDCTGRPRSVNPSASLRQYREVMWLAALAGMNRKVTLADQSTYDAKVVGFDQDKDVAVLHIEAPKVKLRPIPVGVSADLLVGQKVYAIGNPFGLDHTLTTGVIRTSFIKLFVFISTSGLRREISSAATGRPIQDVIQTDAAINPGNSGGPLLDSSGSLIGINTAIYSPSGASSGVGFSIPVDTVGGIVEQLVKFGKVTRPILGIKFAPDQSVEQLGVSGVLVLDAPLNGPAGKAGLQSTKRDAFGRLILGDIITSVNGKKVGNGSDLYRILDQCKVGEKFARIVRKKLAAKTCSQKRFAIAVCSFRGFPPLSSQSRLCPLLLASQKSSPEPIPSSSSAIRLLRRNSNTSLLCRNPDQAPVSSSFSSAIPTGGPAPIPPFLLQPILPLCVATDPYWYCSCAAADPPASTILSASADHHRRIASDEHQYSAESLRICWIFTLMSIVIIEVLRGYHKEKLPVVLEPKPDES